MDNMNNRTQKYFSPSVCVGSEVLQTSY